MFNRQRKYIGRFAPSPSGPLHFGSLVTAVASYLQARSQGGRWHVRIEDIDPPRAVQGASKQIIRQLTSYGFRIDGKVILQSQNLARYNRAIEQWQNARITYPCQCTRRKLSSQSVKGPLGVIYPGNCKDLKLAYNPAKHVLRLTYPPGQKLRFYDATYGLQQMDCARLDGDFIVLRRDRLPTYALACSIDDQFENYSEIVRGADLLEQTFRQIRINQVCNRRIPGFRHVPLVVDRHGSKLSKQNYASALPISAYRYFLYAALDSLGQQPPKNLYSRRLTSIWQWAIRHWNADKIPRSRTVRYFMDT